MCEIFSSFFVGSSGLVTQSINSKALLSAAIISKKDKKKDMALMGISNINE